MIYLITSMNGINEEKWLNRIKALMYEGLDNVIIREKEIDGCDLEKLVREIKKYQIENLLNTKIIVHSNLELAEKLGVDGIHIPYNVYSGYDYISKGRLREWKEHGIIGFSAHSIEEVQEIEVLADYVLMSPVFKPSCKNIDGNGIRWIQNISYKSNVEIVALGGIKPDNVQILYDSGIESVAIMSELMRECGKIIDFKRKCN